MFLNPFSFPDNAFGEGMNPPYARLLLVIKMKTIVQNPNDINRQEISETRTPNDENETLLQHHESSIRVRSQSKRIIKCRVSRWSVVVKKKKTSLFENRNIT